VVLPTRLVSVVMAGMMMPFFVHDAVISRVIISSDSSDWRRT
jgi:hypothetical protein